MKRLMVLISIFISSYILNAAKYDPSPEIQSLISMVNADTIMTNIQHLQDYQTRYALVDNHLEIANWIRSQFENYGLTNTYLQDYQHQGTTQYNVVATIPGSIYPDIYVIVGGHYDSYSSSNFMVYAPGADDNASGTSGVLEMARVMMESGYQPKCSIRFVTFSAEEGWGWGSEEYCTEATAENQNIRLMVNMDMIASNQLNSSQFNIVPYDGFMEHCNTAIDISEEYSTLQPVVGPLNEGSDSIIFWQWGFPAVFFFEKDFNPYYHSSEDVIGHLNMAYCAEIVRAATATAAIYSNKPLPSLGVRVTDTGAGNSLLAEWDSSEDISVDHYRVYYGTNTDSLSLWQNITGNQCVISGITEGQHTYVAITAIDNASNESTRVYDSGIPLSTPLTPASFTDHPLNSAINLTWTPNSELDLQEYRIYRSLDPDEVGELLATISASENSYSDTDVIGSMTYYCYRICAVDTQNNQSDLSEAVMSRPATLNMGLLVVDESKNFGGTNPFQPSDLQVDSFYDNLLDSFSDVNHLDLEAVSDTIRLADYGVYSTIVWHGNDNADMGYPFGIRDDLRSYIALGGNILFSVYKPSMAFELNSGYPMTFDTDSFINEVMGISGVNFSSSARFKAAVPTLASFPELTVDSLKTISSMNGHIFGIESIEAVNPEDIVYTYASNYAYNSSQGVLNGQSVGVLHHYGAGRALTLSFPLYNMQESAARVMVHHVVSDIFNEPSPVADDINTNTPSLLISPNYPNPFSKETSFRIQVKNRMNLLDVKVYNIKGQIVRELYEAIPNAENQITWDGKDSQGKHTSSGVYILRARQMGKTVTRKILMLRS